MMASLDGYVADKSGNFDWAKPDEQVHRFINDLVSETGTQLYGRRMYETMKVWESPEFSEGVPAYIADFARLWRASDKVVYSRTLDSVSTERTRLRRTYDPEEIGRMKADAAQDLTISGPVLASQAFHAGIVDEIQLFVAPVVVGSGLAAFPDVDISLRLLDEHRFDNGMLYARYAVSQS